MKKMVFVVIGAAFVALGVLGTFGYFFKKKRETVDDEQTEAKKAWHWFNKKENKRKEDETVDVVVKGFTA